MEIKEAVSHSQDWRVSGVQIVLEEGGGLIMIITESHLSVWGDFLAAGEFIGLCSVVLDVLRTLLNLAGVLAHLCDCVFH